MPLDPCYLELMCALAPQVSWDKEKTERFSALFDLLLETNARMNVTAVTGKMGVTLKHFVDSLSLLRVTALAAALENARVCDMGCGGGFPGLPLAIACPGAEIVMIDSTEKKIRAVRENAARLGLTSVFAFYGRGEELGKAGEDLRESFSAVVSRAVAPLPVLTELCLPLVKPGGVFIAMKGAKSEEELLAARRGAGQLGSGKPERIPVSFPDPDFSGLSDEDRAELRVFLRAERDLIVFQKQKPTPAQFPRSWAVMKRKPL